MIALTIYVAVDWYRTPKTRCPASPQGDLAAHHPLHSDDRAIGPIVWLAPRWVSRAERRHVRPRPLSPTAPDDDPEFLFRSNDIQQKTWRNAAGVEQGQQGSESDGNGALRLDLRWDASRGATRHPAP